MMDTKDNTLPFEDKAQYRVGNTTYVVTAHFSGGIETLKSKISNLITDNIHKSDCTIASGQGDVVK